MDIQVIGVDPTTGKVSWGLNSKSISGLSELAQIVILSLLNVPGRDVLDPEKGGGLPEMIGTNTDPENLNEITAEVARRVRKTQKEIVAQQIGLNLPAEAKLRDVQILSVAYGPTTDQIDIRLRVINMAGRQTDILL